MSEKKLRALVGLLFLLGSPGLQSCVKEESLIPDDAAKTSDSTITAPSSEKGAAYIRLELAWETGNEYVQYATCALGEDAAVGDSKECEVVVPEGRLFLSKLRFVVGTSKPESCSIVLFQPYYYRGEISATYSPPWKDPAGVINCSGASPSDKDCYNGIAKSIISDFPKKRSSYHLSEEGLEAKYDSDSSNNLEQKNNKYTSNSLIDTATDQADYTGNSMVHYRVTCKNKWFDDRYTVILKIVDEDTATGDTPITDTYSDWNI